MMRIVVEAKNDGLVDRFWMTTPSTTRTSRYVVCSIHWRRTRLVEARIDGWWPTRRRANSA